MFGWWLAFIIVVAVAFVSLVDYEEVDKEEEASSEDENEKAIRYSKALANELKKKKEDASLWEKMYKEKEEEISQLQHELRMWKHQNMFNFGPLFAKNEEHANQHTKSNEQSLSDYLRDVCYREKIVTFYEDENDFYVKTIENDAYIYLLLQRKDTLQAKGIVAKDVMRLIDIDFLQYGEKERYLVRNYFEKVVKDYLSNELEVKREKDNEMQKEKQRREQEVTEMKEQEDALVTSIIRKHEEIQEMIQKIKENDIDIPIETTYKLEKHYTADIEAMIRAFRSLSLEDKNREHAQFLSALEEVKHSLKRDIEYMEKEKVFTFKKQMKVLQERMRD